MVYQLELSDFQFRTKVISELKRGKEDKPFNEIAMTSHSFIYVLH